LFSTFVNENLVVTKIKANDKTAIPNTYKMLNYLNIKQ